MNNKELTEKQNKDFHLLDSLKNTVETISATLELHDKNHYDRKETINKIQNTINAANQKIKELEI
jgi:hypothetical protein